MTDKDILTEAYRLTVLCGGCNREALPRKVLGLVTKPQHNGINIYAIVEFACDTFDCGAGIQLEVDL